MLVVPRDGVGLLSSAETVKRLIKTHKNDRTKLEKAVSAWHDGAAPRGVDTATSRGVAARCCRVLPCGP